MRLRLLKFELIQTLVAGFLLWWSSLSSAQTQDPVFVPQFQNVTYRRHVPSSMARTARKVGPTLFFGTFTWQGETLAAHFYDVSKVHRQDGELSARSRFDLFLRGPSQKWRRVQSLSLTRFQWSAKPSIKVQLHALYLDPDSKQIPLLQLTVIDGSFEGTRRWVNLFAAFPHGWSGKEATRNFDGEVPESMSTVTLSELSFPDETGSLTILNTTSDPGSTAYQVFRWKENHFEAAETKSFPNIYEKAFRWNGRAFVPLSPKSDVP